MQKSIAIVLLVIVSSVLSVVIDSTAGSGSVSGASAPRAQNFFTHSGGPWNNIQYNFYSNEALTAPSAAGLLYIFNHQYTGSVAGLPSAGALAVATSSNGYWNFPASFQLLSDSTYFVYQDTALPGNIAYENPATGGRTTYYYSGSSYVPLGTLEKFSVQGSVLVASVCGNSIVEVGEACDGGACCTSTCQLASASTVCRNSAGPCDEVETCTGTSTACPADAFEPSSMVCRPAVDSCDFAESCTGSSASCPEDAFSVTATCFCARQTFVGGDYAQNYFCADDSSFFQCLQGPWASQSRQMSCGAGTHCGCTSGECSCGGYSSPCVMAGQPQVC